MSPVRDPLAEIRARVALIFRLSTPLEQARAKFLGEWVSAVATMSDAELTKFQADLQQRMTLIAKSPLARGGRS